MAEVDQTLAEGAVPVLPKAPQVRPATIADIQTSLVKALEDMRAAPLLSLFFGVFYAFGGLVSVYLLTRQDMLFLAFPMAAGFALLGPFVAVGLYEISRRRETGEPLDFGTVLGCMTRQGSRELGWMALVTVFAFVIWMYQIRLMFAGFFGVSARFSDAGSLLFGSVEGLLFLGIGTVWGAVLATIMFALTVVSFPLLLDRDVDFVTAMITSVKAVFASPVVMVGWGLVTAALLFFGAMPLFIGFIVLLPLLGHTTWHLYRRIVLPADVGSGVAIR